MIPVNGQFESIITNTQKHSTNIHERTKELHFNNSYLFRKSERHEFDFMIALFQRIMKVYSIVL